MNPREWLKQFGFSATDGPEDPAHIEKLERLIGVRLDAHYRSFLQQIGGGHLRDVIVPCTVPTPFGEHVVTTLHSIKEVIELLNSTVAPRNMICIGYGHFGSTTCLSVAGLDHGHVFSLDTEMRFFWDQDKLSRFPDLDPTVKEFFRMRDADELPEHPWGYENCYHVADSFIEFLKKMHLADDSSR
jgi:SMI1-KNR4 cell-wall